MCCKYEVNVKYNKAENILWNLVCTVLLTEGLWTLGWLFTGTEVEISVEMHQNTILNPMNIINWLEMIVPVMQ